MYSILKETEELAYSYFSAFGFNDEEITSLIEHGKRDMLKEIEKLRQVVETTPSNIEEINNRLHALKGLFSQLGHHTLVSKINTLRADLESEKTLKELSKILFEKTH